MSTSGPLIALLINHAGTSARLCPDDDRGTASPFSRSPERIGAGCAAIQSSDGVIDARVKLFTSLRLEALDKMALQQELDAIGQLREERQLR